MPKSAQSKSTPSSGVLSSKRKDNLYQMDTMDFIYTSPWIVTENATRHAAAILLSANNTPFSIGVGGRYLECSAALVPPLVARDLVAKNTALISVNVMPSNLSYYALSHLQADNIVPLDRACYAALDQALNDAYEGDFSLVQAAPLFDEVVARTLHQLPTLSVSDSHTKLLLKILEAHPTCTLTELAQYLGLSYERASRIFSASIGLSLKSYLCWYKMIAAGKLLTSDCTLTEVAHEAGFSDAAHFSRTWKRNLGLSPSYLRDDNCVQYIR